MGMDDSQSNYLIGRSLILFFPKNLNFHSNSDFDSDHRSNASGDLAILILVPIHFDSHFDSNFDSDRESNISDPNSLQPNTLLGVVSFTIEIDWNQIGMIKSPKTFGSGLKSERKFNFLEKK